MGRLHPADRGLQPERTTLAWRRTALEVAVVGSIGARLVVGRSTVLAVVLLLVVLTAAGLALRAGAERRPGASRRRHRLPASAAVLVLAQLAGGAVALVWVLVGVAGG